MWSSEIRPMSRFISSLADPPCRSMDPEVTVGDSPLDPVSNIPIRAKPDFDDSQWETVDLTPQSAAPNPITGMPGYVPGWTARGHKGYWGYAWYRIRVQVDSGPDVKLALAGPPAVDDSYQVFDNGTL